MALIHRHIDLRRGPKKLQLIINKLNLNIVLHVKYLDRRELHIAVYATIVSVIDFFL